MSPEHPSDPLRPEDFLPSLNLPQPRLKFAREGQKLMIWDRLRGKYLRLTPEEWVRQHVLHYLQNQFAVPAAAIATEAGFKLNGMLRRSDILVLKENKPCLLVECKAPKVKINQQVFDQVFRYNRELNCRYIALSNGLEQVFATVQQGELRFLKTLPTYRQW